MFREYIQDAEQHLLDFSLALINNVHVLYQQPTLSPNLEIVIVRYEMWKAQPVCDSSSINIPFSRQTSRLMSIKEDKPSLFWTPSAATRLMSIRERTSPTQGTGTTGFCLLGLFTINKGCNSFLGMTSTTRRPPLLESLPWPGCVTRSLPVLSSRVSTWAVLLSWHMKWGTSM